MSEATAFDAATPPLKVTNPGMQVDTSRTYLEYPRHLHRADGTFRVVTTDAEKVAALAEGWYLTPGEATAPPAVIDTEPPIVSRGPGRPRKIDPPDAA